MQMTDRMRWFLEEVNRDNSGWLPMASRFYADECEAEIREAHSRGWVEVSMGSDGISGDFATVTITRAGRAVIGAPEPQRRSFKQWLFSVLKHT